MLTSSQAYLQALRESKYLQFLEWPFFIIQHFPAANNDQDADSLRDLLVFEWLNNGFGEADIKQMAVLHALFLREINPLKGNLAYAFTSLVVAMLQCMVFTTLQLPFAKLTQNDGTKIETQMDVAFIIACIKQSELAVEAKVFKQCLDDQQVQFLACSQQAEPSKIDIALQQIAAITTKRELVEEYLFLLDSTEIDNDQLKMSRSSVLRRFADYLNEQREFTPVVSKEIDNYVSTIREMEPAPFEEAFLNAVTPLSFVDNTLRRISDFGQHFFSIRKPALSLSSPAIEKPAF